MKISNTQKSEYNIKARMLVASKGGHIDEDWAYSKSRTKIGVTCGRGHRWETCWNSLQSDQWCPNCATERTLARIEDSKVGQLPPRKRGGL